MQAASKHAKTNALNNKLPLFVSTRIIYTPNSVWSSLLMRAHQPSLPVRPSWFGRYGGMQGWGDRNGPAWISRLAGPSHLLLARCDAADSRF
jgi:hypothetical protein